jgi:2-oxoisovalerate dehydrogenase E1 component alpha subunit
MALDGVNVNGALNESLSLRIPEPTTLPGDVTDFSTLGFPGAGETRRPDVTDQADTIADLATGLIRVLDDDGEAVGPWRPAIKMSQLRDGLRHMIMTREFDRLMLLAQRQGKTSFYMQCTGEEAVACAFRAALRDGDMNFPTYRQQGLLIAGGYPLELMFSQVYSNTLDPLHGRQMPVFYSSRDYGFFSISGNLATQYVQAVGWAMASAMRGETAVTAAWIGDGATAESDFHAAMVMASTYNPPVILNIVNNQWAISTNQVVARGRAATFASRGQGFGIPALRVDGNDYLAALATAQWAIERARSNLGPTLIEWVTYRKAAHSSSDDPSVYRAKDDASSWPLGDPIERLKHHLIRVDSWTEVEQRALESEVAEVVSTAQSKAEMYGTLLSGSAPSPREIFEDVYREVPEHLRRQRDEAGY